jgi:ketosteroid isomerase-like protein
MSDSTVVQAFLDGFRAGDIETALSVLHDDLHVSEPAGLPTGGEYRGKAAFVGFLQHVASLYEVELRGAKLIDGGDVTVAVIDATWTGRETGRQLVTQFVELYTVVDGLVTAINVFPKDTRALYELVQVSAPA